ncbi:hypothetical protein [Porphyrobacter sp. YT40]|uniref:hypothetical protein n=1 Tax=Porphyrobacter sp. YT40 TaxID=2547601 RepID=UPI0011449FD4|nr:hypothetical protein [Porphyrobacter sp. YT40]QDH34571.1 hypothetical protein E2E27_09675 [Porphyrobacter sp. YT40]
MTGRLLYWPLRLFLELLGLGLALFVLRALEKEGLLDFMHFEMPDWLRVHLIYGLLVFWLARWRPWTIWLTGAIYLFLMAFGILLAGALFMSFNLSALLLVAIIGFAYRLGKSQHRKLRS